MSWRCAPAPYHCNDAPQVKRSICTVNGRHKFVSKTLKKHHATLCDCGESLLYLTIVQFRLQLAAVLAVSVAIQCADHRSECPTGTTCCPLGVSKSVFCSRDTCTFCTFTHRRRLWLLPSAASSLLQRSPALLSAWQRVQSVDDDLRSCECDSFSHLYTRLILQPRSHERLLHRIKRQV